MRWPDLDLKNELEFRGRKALRDQLLKVLLDAVTFDKTLGGRYEDVRDQAYAERVILAYWRRYAPAWDAQTLARTHNGGPKGATRNSTLQYWHDVRSRMR